MKKVLLIAYHFPPVQVSSGLQRTLAMTQYLPSLGWQPVVLSASPRAYERTSPDQLRDIPEGVSVTRAFALDTARHLSLGGRYFDFMALPDRWVSWWLGGVLSGLKLIRKERPSVIWSTYPIATAHLIGMTLSRLTGIPWVADFRDSMTEESYPPEPRRKQVFQWIERKTVQRCSRAVFTTPGALRMYAERYPDISARRWLTIPNGYNEHIFSEVEQSLARMPLNVRQPGSPRVLVHSGVIYPSERDPVPFFNALASLKREGKISSAKVKFVLRATGHDAQFRPLLAERDIDDLVELAPSINYREALMEMLQADGLLLFQAANCNHQIPAKVYEYIRAQKPIFAMTDRKGDTAATLLGAGVTSIVPLDNADQIALGISEFLQAVESGEPNVPSWQAVTESSREHMAKLLAAALEQVVTEK